VYGLTKNISTYNPLRVATHEYASIARDLRAAHTWRDRLRHLVNGPGWQPAQAQEATPQEARPNEPAPADA
jgi:hypothetical protein